MVSTKPKMKQTPLRKLRDRLEDYLKELPVIAFNSGKYDLNAVKEFLFPVLVKNEQVQFTIKRNNNIMCQKTDHLCFLDVTNFHAPGFNYKFLRAYECTKTKGFFLYEWMDSLEKLQNPALPPHQACYSYPSNKNISIEEYSYCQQVWSNNNMQTLKDFLYGIITLTFNHSVTLLKKFVLPGERKTLICFVKEFLSLASH